MNYNAAYMANCVSDYSSHTHIEIQAMPRPRTPKFRYWDYPEPGLEALKLLSNSPVRSELVSLLEDGSADEIAEWLEAPGIPETVRTILRQGLRGETDFDAVEVGRLAWDDHLGTLTQCSAIRQSDGKVMYQVMQDGDLIAEFLSSRELSGVKVRNLMVTGDIEDDDYTGYASFRASSNYHSDLHSWEGSQEDE